MVWPLWLSSPFYNNNRFSCRMRVRRPARSGKRSAVLRHIGRPRTSTLANLLKKRLWLAILLLKRFTANLYAAESNWRLLTASMIAFLHANCHSEDVAEFLRIFDGENEIFHSLVFLSCLF